MAREASWLQAGDIRRRLRRLRRVRGAFAIVRFLGEKKEDCRMFETVLDDYVTGRLGYFSAWPMTSDSPNAASALYEDARKAFAAAVIGVSSVPELDLRLAAWGF